MKVGTSPSNLLFFLLLQAEALRVTFSLMASGTGTRPLGPPSRFTKSSMDMMFTLLANSDVCSGKKSAKPLSCFCFSSAYFEEEKVQVRISELGHLDTDLSISILHVTDTTVLLEEEPRFVQ
jgi:hypothetical protein